MAYRMAIEHRTRFEYAAPVNASYNEARMTPLSTMTQVAIESSVEIDQPAHLSRYWDYWSTLVHAFDLQAPHTSMVVTARSVVERMTGLVQPLPEVSWEVLESEKVKDELCEYLGPSRWVPDDPDIEAVGGGLRVDAASPRDALTGALAWVRSQLRYQAGITTASTSAVEAWRNGRGVCQDFVHLSLAVLRGAGVPARYVSGYLHPHVEPQVGVTAAGESHAWLEAWIGDWLPFDPTNMGEVAERHVLVARGRDYGDVTPLKGIYSGGPAASSEAVVELTRLA